MRKSIIYTVVLLTLFSLCFTLIPQVHSQTANVKVVTYSWYIDNAGLLDVVGEIQNVGTSIISSVILSGTAITTTGNQQTSNTMAYVKNMLPNQKAPFYMTFFLQTDQATQSTPTIANVEVDSKLRQPTQRVPLPRRKSHCPPKQHRHQYRRQRCLLGHWHRKEHGHPNRHQRACPWNLLRQRG